MLIMVIMIMDVCVCVCENEWVLVVIVSSDDCSYNVGSSRKQLKQSRQFVNQSEREVEPREQKKFCYSCME